MTQIRPLHDTDFPAWRDLWRAYLAFYQTSRPDAQFNDTWARIMDDDSDLHARVAVDENGTLIGLVHFLYHPTFWDTAPRCYLNDLYLHPDARGSGAAAQMIDAVNLHAAQRNAQVYWLTAEDNARARALYDRVATKTAFIKYQV